jgi:2-polyprenyl-6-methoxyphenol hydroxylase-like FAD-dependent oxidoreductase
MASVLNDVVIIGAGLGVSLPTCLDTFLSRRTQAITAKQGAALALALHQHSISCRIYEAGAEGFVPFGTGVSIAPNGCRVLDALGVLERIKPQSYLAEFSTLKNAEGHTTARLKIASEEVHGYKIHRVHRRVLVQELRAMLRENKIPIEYGAKFEGVVEDGPDGVTFRVAGREERATLLIGADGMWSSVRRHITTDTVPQYTGMLAVGGHIPTGAVPWPSHEDFEKVATVQDKPGALFMMPHGADGSEMLIATQFAHPPRDPAGWAALAGNSDELSALLRNDYDQWHDLARSIIDSLSTSRDSLLFWPSFRMPALDRWSSTSGRVVILGDAAHAIPPSSYQGANQALEDAYTLASLLSLRPPENTLAVALDRWRAARQARVDAVLKMAERADVSRLPEAERLRLEQEMRGKDQGTPQEVQQRVKWLYGGVAEQEVKSWMSA